MLDKLKKFFKKPEPVVEKSEQPKKEKKPRKTREQPAPNLSEKEMATQNGQPFVAITRVEVDPNDINNGSFELDWNDKFVVNLVKQGYKIRPDDTDAQIVDRWFQTVCRNVALEVYEQEAADPNKRDDVRVIRQRDLGNGRTEIS